MPDTTGVSAAPSPRKPVPRWATIAAGAVPLCVLPSAAWRLHVVFDAWSRGAGPCRTIGSPGEGIYVASLSAVSLAAACLTLGLVRPWGERFPRWLPLVGGRSVPARPVTLIATLGAALIALLLLYAVVVAIVAPDWTVEPLPPGCNQPGWDVGMFYVPLLAWPPLLYLVARDYRRRRAGADAASDGDEGR